MSRANSERVDCCAWYLYVSWIGLKLAFVRVVLPGETKATHRNCHRGNAFAQLQRCIRLQNMLLQIFKSTSSNFCQNSRHLVRSLRIRADVWAKKSSVLNVEIKTVIQLHFERGLVLFCSGKKMKKPASFRHQFQNQMAWFQTA